MTTRAVYNSANLANERQYRHGPQRKASSDATAREQIIKLEAESLTAHLLTRIKQSGLPEPVLEHEFHPTRFWRFDLAWPARLLAVEIDGGTWSGGRHTRSIGFRGDCEKLNAAQLLGWVVLRFTSDMVEDDPAINLVVEAFGGAEVIR